MNIKFLSTGSLEEWRHTTANPVYAQIAVWAALHDANTPPTRRNEVMDAASSYYFWRENRAVLDVFPIHQGESTDPDHPPNPMTWGIWADALRGIDGFSIAYPGVEVRFEIYVYPSPSREETFIGFGALQFSDFAPSTQLKRMD